MSFQPLARLMELDEGFRRVVRVGAREYLLLHSDGQTHLIERHCPHAGAPLDRSAVGEGILTCPRHGIRFDLRTGRPDTAGCAVLQRYQLTYDGDRIGVDV